jgi:anti-sigma B factor antagonist
MVAENFAVIGRKRKPLFVIMQTGLRNVEEPTMKVEMQGETLNVSGIKELGAANSQLFRDEVKGALGEKQKNIEIDLSETMFVDSCGLGALISLHKTTCNRNGTVRLLNPTPPVQQILELTRMHRIFEIVQHP